jgi:hypothetical protein
MDNHAMDPNSRTKSARLQGPFGTLANRISDQGYIIRAGITRVDAQDFDLDAVGHQINRGFEDRNVAAPASGLSDLMDPQFHAEFLATVRVYHPNSRGRGRSRLPNQRNVRLT